MRSRAAHRGFRWGIVQRQDPGFWCQLRGFESLCPSHREEQPGGHMASGLSCPSSGSVPSTGAQAYPATTAPVRWVEWGVPQPHPTPPQGGQTPTTGPQSDRATTEPLCGARWIPMERTAISRTAARFALSQRMQSKPAASPSRAMALTDFRRVFEHHALRHFSTRCSCGRLLQMIADTALTPPPPPVEDQCEPEHLKTPRLARSDSSIGRLRSPRTRVPWQLR